MSAPDSNKSFTISEWPAKLAHISAVLPSDGRCALISRSNKRIIIDKNPTYIKDNIGIIERINKILINKAKSMFLYTNLPTYLEGEVILTATYLYNLILYNLL